MTHEWQLTYREFGEGGVGRGPLLTINVICEAEDMVHGQFCKTVSVVTINHVRAIVDWNKPNFDREEAALYLTCKSSTLSTKKADGILPFAEYGQAIYPRAWLDKHLENCANAPAKAIVKELKAA